MTTIHDIDDPRLTAYALGELERDETAAVEAFLADNAEARAFVDETRALAGTLSAGLAGELESADAAVSGGGPGLDAGRRAALAEAAASGVAGLPSPARPPVAASQPLILRVRPYLAAAAVLLVAVVATHEFLVGGGGGAAGGEASAPFGYDLDLAANARDAAPQGAATRGPAMTRERKAHDGASAILARPSSPAAGRAVPSSRQGDAGEALVITAHDRSYAGSREALSELGYAGGAAVDALVKDAEEQQQDDQLRALGYGGSASAEDTRRRSESAVALLDQMLSGAPAGGVDPRAAFDADDDAGPAAPVTAFEAPTDGAALGGEVALEEPELLRFALADEPVATDAFVGLAVQAPAEGDVTIQIPGGVGGETVDAHGEALWLRATPEQVAQLEAIGYVGGSASYSAKTPAGTGAATPAPAGSSAGGGNGSNFNVRSNGFDAIDGGLGEDSAAAPASQGVTSGTVELKDQQDVSGSPGLLTGRGRKLAMARRGVDPAAERALRSMGYLDHDDGRSDAERRRSYARASGERYAPIHENEFVPLTSDPLSALSTFGVDVDRASYTNVRRFLHRNELPPPDAVRLEELVNAFRYDDAVPEGEHPFAVAVDGSACPWEPRHRLVRVQLSTAGVVGEERPPVQLVFLLDVSGSMKDADKLPLLIHSLELLLDELDERDRVAVVTYAAGSQVVLPSTSCAEKDTILAALRGLRADGSTHASAGIELAYEVASQGFVEGGNNRVLMATDGDFNVGVTDDAGLHAMIRDKAASGVFLTVLGFGSGNLKDATAELLADNGNGQYAYIDTLNEAHRVLVDEVGATLVTVAKDVKVQVEFNPAHVAAYRLLGYENRKLAATDFRDDRKDAGEIGAGHSVTALYEIRPTGLPPLEGTADLKYQPVASAAPGVAADDASPELLSVNLRYKQPDGEVGIELSVPYTDGEAAFEQGAEDLRFAAAVAAFGMILRGSEHAGAASLAWVVETADAARGFDPDGDRAEFVRLARTAQGLLGR